MALDKGQLKGKIKSLLENLAAQTEDPANAREVFATELSDAIDEFVKSGDGAYQTGRLTAGPYTVIATNPVVIKMK